MSIFGVILLPIFSAVSFSPKIKRVDDAKTDVKFKERCLKQGSTIFTHGNGVNLFVFYKLDTWSQNLNVDFTAKDCFFGAFRITEIVYLDKYSYSEYGNRSDSFESLFLLSSLIWVKMLLFWSRKLFIRAYWE